jgi:hypothetical protein
MDNVTVIDVITLKVPAVDITMLFKLLQRQDANIQYAPAAVGTVVVLNVLDVLDALVMLLDLILVTSVQLADHQVAPIQTGLPHVIQHLNAVCKLATTAEVLGLDYILVHSDTLHLDMMWVIATVTISTQIQLLLH